MRRRGRGFTLLEMLGAIAVLALGFALLLNALQSSVQLTRHSDDRTHALLWAQSFLDSHFAMQPVRPGVSQGHFDNRYRWRLVVRPWMEAGQRSPQSTGSMRLYRLDLTVAWGRDSRPYSVHLATLRVASANATAGQH
jgi:general secretion pathway protein I